ncbi:MAG: hypothetical protein M3Q86_10135 [Verrucomicrobiota bacterium]|nr:hypothetical protein [Verrucomicrobiota bacterium]
MSFRKRLLVFLLALLVAGILDALCAPFVIAHGVRWWIAWAAQRQGLAAEIGQVDAPFLRPVTIRNLSIGPGKGAGREVSLRASNVEVDLNLRGWLFRKHANLLRSIRVQHLAGNIRIPVKAQAVAKLDWRPWSRLLPDEFQLHELNLDVATATTSVSCRGVLVTASAIESGRFFAREISVTAPLLRQTFRNLRGATSWESSRLTIAGIPLARGLDLEALTLDLSRLAKRRLGVDLQLDTFGGTLRASFQGRGGDKFSADLAGSAANVSLAQISSAMGFLEPVTGSVRASKFTFRGNPGEFLDATASIWMEATDFAWRARRAESVMLGATYYDRRLVVDQLYVRQRENELTVNGELLWPERLQSWAQLPFRGQINAAIPDLNGFAQLFGATTGDFSGALSAKGEVDLVGLEASGRLAWDGQEVTFRGVNLNSLGAAIQLHGREVALENLEVRHGEDFLRAQGSVELADGHRFSGRLTGAIGDLGVYAPLLPAAWRSGKIGGGATFDWRGDGTRGAHSGTVQLFAHGLQLPVAPFRSPLDLTLEGSYSPRDIFFRTFSLANERFSLGGFLMLGSNFIELQAFELSLEGARRGRGTIFLPLSFERWRTTRSWLAALDEEQKFDLDLSFDQLDLAQLGRALGEDSLGSGVLDGKLAAFGLLRTLQVTTDWRLQNVGTEAAPNAIDFSGRLEGGRLEASASAKFGVSEPVSAQVWLPLRLEKKQLEAGNWLDPAAPLFASVACPALFLETLPNEWQPGHGRGLVTGNISWNGKYPAPAVSGEGDILDAAFRPPPPWPEVTALRAHFQVAENAAVIDPLQGNVDSIPVDLRGRLSTSRAGFGLTIFPGGSEIELLSQPPAGAGFFGVRVLGEGRREGRPLLREALVRGTLWPAAISLTITEQAGPDTSSVLQTTYLSDAAGPAAGSFLLRVVPPESAEGFGLSDERKETR